MTNIYDTSTNPTVPFSIPFTINKPLTIAIELAPKSKQRQQAITFGTC